MSLIFALSLIVTYEMPVDPERMDEFMAWIESGIEASRSAAGNLQFDVFVDPDRPGYVLFVERWESDEAQKQYMAWRAQRGELEQMSGYLVGPLVKHTWREGLQLDGWADCLPPERP